MSQKKDIEYEHIEEELVSLFQGLLAQLAPEVASLDVSRVSDGIVTVLKPKNPESAQVMAHAENGLGLIDFSIGEYDPTWELPYEGHTRNPNKTELLQEVEGMCRAVIAGHCEVERGFLTVTGRIQVGSHPYKVCHLLVWRVTPPFKGIRKYQPYAAPS